MDQKLSCIIVDDEPVGIQLIEAFLKKMPYMKHLASFDNAASALAFLETNHADILISDIQMPGLSGLEMVRSLPFSPEVIFTTAHRNFAADGFDVDAADFLLKPMNFGRFQTAIDKARIRLQSKWIARPPTTAFIFIKQEHSHVKVPLQDIAYLEAMGDYMQICLADHLKLITRSTLTEIQAKLPADKFIRVHKSFVINMAMIQAIHPSQITLSTGQEIPIARSYRSMVSTKLGIK